MWTNKVVNLIVERLNTSLGFLGVIIISRRWYSELTEADRLAKVGAAFIENDQSELSVLLRESCSQRLQDLVGYIYLNRSMDKPGYFIEIGGADGITGSNTLAFEKLGWDGLVVEPARGWHSALKANRRCKIDFRAVYAIDGEQIDFIESGELSTISAFKSADYHIRRGETYTVETVCPETLFTQHRVPNYVDFLSLDTEGSEIVILKSIDFEKREFGFICVEHNYSPARQEIRQFLNSVGYTRVLETLSRNDDFFIPAQHWQKREMAAPSEYRSPSSQAN